MRGSSCRLDDKSLAFEIQQSCQTLRDELSDLCPVFAYPNGQPQDFDDRAIKLLSEQGIQASVTTIEGLGHHRQKPFEIHRVPVSYMTDLARTLRSQTSWAGIPFRLKQRIKRWF
ncbi:MAG: hypothetical protein CMJ78_22885 [Planctomycetaceae bacterium]|nr:hypothetical protein [Planctomycetaceae bacterium]